MQVKIKRIHNNAVLPKYAKNGDAGMDLTCVSRVFTDKYIEYKTGLAFEIPEGYVGLLFPRSSISNKDLYLSNAVGVLDSGYRGEVTFRFKTTDAYGSFYKEGERVGQIIVIPHPKIEFIESNELTDTDRGVGGYGSTGK